MMRPPPSSTLFPYPTLFRSIRERAPDAARPAVVRRQGERPVVELAIEILQILSGGARRSLDRKSTRLNSSHQIISYAVFCLKKKNDITTSKDNHTSTRQHLT